MRRRRIGCGYSPPALFFLHDAANTATVARNHIGLIETLLNDSFGRNLSEWALPTRSGPSLFREAAIQSLAKFGRHAPGAMLRSGRIRNDRQARVALRQEPHHAQ